MTRDAFMKELVYLLQDIQEEDKEDALQYYMDYFDEAGPEQEADIIKELGSPERIAAIIRSDIAGHLEDGGEFTESGYQDERFRDPNYQVAKRSELPDCREYSQAEGSGENEHKGQNQESTWQNSSGNAGPGRQPSPPRTSMALKVVLWIVLFIVGGPILLALGSGALGIAGGILGILVGVLVLVGVLTIAMLICGVAMIPFGIVHIFSHPLNGFLLSGTGLIILGIGILLLALAVLFYGRFIPYLIRSIVNFLNRLIHRRRCNP